MLLTDHVPPQWSTGLKMEGLLACWDSQHRNTILQFHIGKVLQIVMLMRFLANQPISKNSVLPLCVYRSYYLTSNNIKLQTRRTFIMSEQFWDVEESRITIYGKTSVGENFRGFHSTTNVFLRIMALSISNISLQKCYSKSFTANSYFPLKM